MPTGNGKNPQFYGLQDSKNGLYAKIFTKTKNSISLDFRFVDLKNTGERATLILVVRWSRKLPLQLSYAISKIYNTQPLFLQLICSQGNHSVQTKRRQVIFRAQVGNRQPSLYLKQPVCFAVYI